jgi:hypothetical protein
LRDDWQKKYAHNIPLAPSIELRFRLRPINTNVASIRSLSISFPSATLPKSFALTFQQVLRFMFFNNNSTAFKIFQM